MPFHVWVPRDTGARWDFDDFFDESDYPEDDPDEVEVTAWKIGLGVVVVLLLVVGLGVWLYRRRRRPRQPQVDIPLNDRQQPVEAPPPYDTGDPSAGIHMNGDSGRQHTEVASQPVSAPSQEPSSTKTPNIQVSERAGG